MEIKHSRKREEQVLKSRRGRGRYWRAGRPAAAAEQKKARTRLCKVMWEVINMWDLSLKPRGLTLGSSHDLFVIFLKYHCVCNGRKNRSQTPTES